MECTIDFSRASEADALILCVPTPLNKYREPNLSYVISTTESIVPHLRAGQVGDVGVGGGHVCLPPPVTVLSYLTSL